MTEQDIRAKFSTVSHADATELKIQPGEWYWAKRNGPGVVLKCAKIHPDDFIVPMTAHYPYDCHECFRALDQTDPVLQTLHEETIAAQAVWSKKSFKANDN